MLGAYMIRVDSKSVHRPAALAIRRSSTSAKAQGSKRSSEFACAVHSWAFVYYLCWPPSSGSSICTPGPVQPSLCTMITFTLLNCPPFLLTLLYCSLIIFLSMYRCSTDTFKGQICGLCDVVIISAYLCFVTRAYALHRPWAFHRLNPISSCKSLPSLLTVFTVYTSTLYRFLSKSFQLPLIRRRSTGIDTAVSPLQCHIFSEPIPKRTSLRVWKHNLRSGVLSSILFDFLGPSYVSCLVLLR